MVYKDALECDFIFNGCNAHTLNVDLAQNFKNGWV
jgi:hypothetical protein